MYLEVVPQESVDLLLDEGFHTVNDLPSDAVGINFSFFSMGNPPFKVGLHYKDGKHYSAWNGHPAHFYALCKRNNRLSIEHMPFGVSNTNPPNWAVAAGPALMIGGQKLNLNVTEWNAGGTQVDSRRARVGVGLNYPWAYFLYVAEGEMTCWEMMDFFASIGCTDAIAGDGGGSASMKHTKGKVLTGRQVPSILYSTKPLFKVALDSGHGSPDPGAVGLAKESELNLAFTKEIINAMRGSKTVAPVGIYLADEDRPLSSLCMRANKVDADVFLSIHSNASASPRAGTGWEIYYVSQRGLRLGSHLSRFIEVATPLYNRGLKKANFTVLTDTAMPAVLYEQGFVDNPYDVELMRNPVHQAKVALAIVYGLEEYRKEVS